MTTADVEKKANRDDLAGADYDIAGTLRLDVLPQFLRDVVEVVGYPFWMRKTCSLSFNTSNRDYDLPAGWRRFEQLHLILSDGSMATAPMTYIGENPEKVIRAEQETTAACPSAYTVVKGSTAKLWAVRIAAPSDASYTARGVYYWTIPNAVDDTDLDLYMPEDVQFGLVHALRMRICEDRIGVDDNRYARAEKAYQRWVDSLYNEPEAAPSGGRAAYVR